MGKLNFVPKPDMFGVPPLSNDSLTDSLILNNLTWLFITPGLSKLTMSEHYSLFEPQFGKFQEYLNRVAGDAGLGGISLSRSTIGQQIVFALAEQPSFSYSLTNTFSSSSWEESIQAQGSKYRVISELINASGGYTQAMSTIGQSLGTFTNMVNDLIGKAGISEKSANELINLVNEASKEQKEAIQKVKQALDTKNSSQLSSLAATVISTMIGRRIDIADLWSNSSASMDYSFTVKLTTLTTCNDEIYKKRIVEPLMVLLTLASPINAINDIVTLNFDSPFLVKIRVPGLVRIDHGAITSMHVSMESGKYSMLQRPREITVSFTVSNLYNVLLMLKGEKEEVPYVGKVAKELMSGIEVPDDLKKDLREFDSKTWAIGE